jgi:hypothetical protein
MTDLIIDNIVEDDEGVIINVSTRPKILIDTGRTFTRSDGTVVARIYERLTKRSRRTQAAYYDPDHLCWGDVGERAYRRGVYDGFKALQEELSLML